MPKLREKVQWRLTPGYYTAKITEWALRTQRTRSVVASVIQRTIPTHDIALGKTRVDVRVEAGADELRRNGFVRFGRVLSDADIDALHTLADNLMCTDPWGDASRQFHAGEAPSDCHTAQYARSDLLRSPLVLELANDPRILSIAKSFLGATPTLSNLTMWWSLAGRPQPKEAQLFHRDRDDLRFCKLFFYLTDVGMSSGPHVYVRGSSTDWKLTAPRRLKDGEVIDTFGEDRIEHFCEPRGHAFLVDTFGVHKGLLPVDTDRLLLQIEYSLLPIGRERYWRDQKLSTAGAYDPYVNRLFVEGGSRFNRRPPLFG